jgi:hypothetical protein
MYDLAGSSRYRQGNRRGARKVSESVPATRWQCGTLSPVSKLAQLVRVNALKLQPKSKEERIAKAGVPSREDLNHGPLGDEFDGT